MMLSQQPHLSNLALALTRRNFLRVGAASVFASSLPDTVRAATLRPASAKRVIFLWIEGGMSHLDTFDPKPDSPASVRGPFGVIDTAVSGIQISEGLPRLAECADDFAILRGVSHGEGGHERATHLMQSGSLPASSGALPDFGSRLAAAGVPFVRRTLTGWDLHRDAFPRLRHRLLPALDAELFGLLTNLRRRGLLETTLVICMGEFGRAPVINANLLPGRDHWPAAMAVILAGGGVRGGQVLGATDALGMTPLKFALRPQDILATIYHLTGVASPGGVASSGRILREICG